MFAVLGVLVLSTGCSRSCGDVWQDTKSCARHVGRGFGKLAGRQDRDERGYSREDFARGGNEDFIPLADEDLYERLVMGDEAALREIDADTPIPQSNVSPGGSIPGVDGFWEPDRGEVAAIFKHLHFDTDKYSIQQQDRRAVKQIAKYLKEHSDTYVFIEGHCDERGPDAYNLSLGSRRSNAVRNELIREGVDLDRLLTVSYGKERPETNGHNADAWKQNRRAQFKIYKRNVG
jgi:peptidoglycan-associated lipoprotein